MTDTNSLLRLMSWLSPAFPTGGFAYSAGLEQAVAGREVENKKDLQNWIATQLEHGALWNDAVFFVQAHALCTNQTALDELAQRAISMTSAAERLDEAITQGTSFLEAASHWVAKQELTVEGTPLPICVGVAAGLQEIECESAVAAYLHAFASNQLQAAIRLSVIGQSAAAEILADMEPIIASVAKRAASSSLEDLGTCAFLADIAAMKHETLQPRLFRS